MLIKNLRRALPIAVLAATACDSRPDGDNAGPIQSVVPPSVDPPLCSFEATYQLTERPLWGYNGELGMHLRVVQAGSQAAVTYTFVPSSADILGQVASGEWTTHVTYADQYGVSLSSANDIALFDPFIGDPRGPRETSYPSELLARIYQANYDDLEAAIPDDDDPESEEAVLPTTRPWARMTPQAPQSRLGCTLARYDRRVEEALVSATEEGSVEMQIPPQNFPSFGTVDWLLFPRTDGSVCKAFGGHQNDEAVAAIMTLAVEGRPVFGCFDPPPPPPPQDAGLPPPPQDAGSPPPQDAGSPPPPPHDAGSPYPDAGQPTPLDAAVES